MKKVIYWSYVKFNFLKVVLVGIIIMLYWDLKKVTQYTLSYVFLDVNSTEIRWLSSKKHIGGSGSRSKKMF